MKKGIHPAYYRCKVTCVSCGATFETGSTQKEITLVAKNRTVVSRAEDLGANDGVTIRFYDGTVRATVTGQEEA